MLFSPTFSLYFINSLTLFTFHLLTKSHFLKSCAEKFLLTYLLGTEGVDLLSFKMVLISSYVQKRKLSEIHSNKLNSYKLLKILIGKTNVYTYLFFLLLFWKLHYVFLIMSPCSSLLCWYSSKDCTLIDWHWFGENWNSMDRILEKYERYSFAERQLIANEPESPVSSYYFHGIAIEFLVLFSNLINLLSNYWKLAIKLSVYIHSKGRP